jgi:hypothetical protein
VSRERTDAVAREALARPTSRRPASRSGGALSAQAGLLLSLQQSVGNRAVSGLVQRWQSAEAEPVAAPRRNDTGLPDALRAGVEALSGISLDDVEVHHNSAAPALLNAAAYAQGTHIHVAPGQEQHLPHEAWHVVQQALGRVEPTTQMKSGALVNNDTKLEREADVMGERALAVGGTDSDAIPGRRTGRAERRGDGPVQRFLEGNIPEHLFGEGAVVDHTKELVLRADRLNKPTAKDLSSHKDNKEKEVKAKAGSTWKAGTNTGQSLISNEANIPEGKLASVKIVKSIPNSLEIRQTGGLHHAELVTKIDMSTSKIAEAITQVKLTDRYDGEVAQLAAE